MNITSNANAVTAYYAHTMALYVVSPWDDPRPPAWRPNTLPLLLALAAGYGGA